MTRTWYYIVREGVFTPLHAGFSACIALRTLHLTADIGLPECIAIFDTATATGIAAEDWLSLVTLVSQVPSKQLTHLSLRFWSKNWEYLPLDGALTQPYHWQANDEDIENSGAMTGARIPAFAARCAIHRFSWSRLRATCHQFARLESLAVYFAPDDNVDEPGGQGVAASHGEGWMSLCVRAEMHEFARVLRRPGGSSFAYDERAELSRCCDR